MAIKIRQSGSWKEISGTLGNDTTYEYLLVDSGSSTGSGTGNDSILRLKPSEGDNDDIKLIAGDNVSFGLDATAGTLQISSSASGTLADVKQYSDNADPRTVRSCINPIEVSGNTIGIGTTSNAYGNKYIQSNDPTTVDGGSNTVCEGDLWYDTSVEGGGGSGGGSSTFIGLTDTPTSYTGQQGKLVKVNANATGLEFSSSGGGGETYTLPLTHTPTASSYSLAWTLTPESGTGSNAVKMTAGNNITFTEIDTTGPNYEFTVNASLTSGSLDPVGTIVAWSGSVENIPTDEYQLCDGGAASTTALQDITGANVPDLRDKFIVGATDSTGDTTYPGLSPGATGGAADAVVVQHNHSITDTGHAHDIKYVNTHINTGHAEESGSGTPVGTNSTESAATGITINNEGVVGTNKNLPPYYSLCYIIKHTAKIVESTSAITKIATVKDVKEYNESGGPCTAQSWNGRDLNTVNDPHSIGITSTTDGIISVPAGTYSFNWTAPAYYIALHNTRLEYSTNDDFPPTNTTTVNGSSAFSSADDPGDSNCQTDSTGMIGSVTFTQTTYVRLVHWTELSSTGSRQNLGLGIQSGYENAGNSVYAQIFIEDLSTAVKKVGDISFTQNGTGAVTRTVDGKLKDNINVWDFIPVGTTTASTDCASYFQAAINTGKTVHVPKGTYRIDSTLLLDGGYETLIGDECMPILLKWTEGPAIQISEPGGSDLNEYSRVENFYIQRQVGGSGSCPNYSATLTESLAGVVVSGHGAGVAAAVRSTRISNLRVGNFAVGFYFADCVGVTVHKCRAQNLTKDYEDATHTANGTPITSSMWGVGFYFDATRYGAAQISPLASIEIVECDDNREGDPTLIKSVSYRVKGDDIRDIFFQRAESSHADYGYYIDGHIDGQTNDDLNWDVHIIRPIIDTFKKHAVYITNVDGVGSVSIIGGYYVAAKNTESLDPEAAIYATNSNGICITGGAQILGVANDTSNYTDEGIKLDSCSSCSIIGNRFANLQYGISLNGTTYSTIQGNVISAASSEDDASPTLHAAIRLWGNSTYNTVGNNTIRGQSASNKYGTGIELESGSNNCKLIGNIIDSTTVANQIDDNASGTDDGTPTVWHVEKTDAQEIHTNPVAWTDITGLSQTVTSASASTKFLINATVNASIMGTGSDGVVRLMRGNTVIGSTSSDSNAVSTKTGFGQVSGQNGQYQSNTLAITYLDTPGTGTHTYHIEGVNSDASIGMMINRRGLNLDFYVTSHMSIQQIS